MVFQSHSESYGELSSPEVEANVLNNFQAKARDRLTFTVPFHHHILDCIMVAKEMHT